MESTEPSAPWFDVETCRTNAPRNSTSPSKSLKNASTSNDHSDHFLYSQFLVDDDEPGPEELSPNPTSNPHQVSGDGSAPFDQSIFHPNSYHLQIFSSSTSAHCLQYSPSSSSSNPSKPTSPSHQGEHTAPLASEISARGTTHNITEQWTQRETSTYEYQTNDDLDWKDIDIDWLLASYFHNFSQYPGLQVDQSIPIRTIHTPAFIESTPSSPPHQDFPDIQYDTVTSDDSMEEPSSTSSSISPLDRPTTGVNPQLPIAIPGSRNEERYIT